MVRLSVRNEVIIGDCREVLKKLPDKSVNCCVTSPPYFNLRTYLQDDHPDKQKELGIETTPEEYVSNLVEVFREVKRVLRDDGTVWLNLSSSYAGGGRGYGYGGKSDTNRGTKNMPRSIVPSGLKPKDMIPIPWYVAIALQNEGWWLRQDLIWSKPNCLPEAVTDRCVKSHEYILLFSKSKKYFFDHYSIQEPAAYDGRKDTKMKGSAKYKTSVVPYKKEHTMAAQGHERWQRSENGEYIRNKRSVWNVNTKPYKGAHFATFPTALIEPCVLAGCPENGVVLDPFCGSGTVGEVCNKLGRNSILIELNPEYKQLIFERVGLS